MNLRNLSQNRDKYAAIMFDNSHLAHDQLLIDLVREDPSIWDSSCPQYRNRSIRKRKWTMIAKKMKEQFPEMTNLVGEHIIEHVKKRWGNLRTYYANLKKRELESQKNCENLYKPVWMFYDQMKFSDNSTKKLHQNLNFITNPNEHDIKQELLDIEEDSTCDENEINENSFMVELGNTTVSNKPTSSVSTKPKPYLASNEIPINKKRKRSDDNNSFELNTSKHCPSQTMEFKFITDFLNSQHVAYLINLDKEMTELSNQEINLFKYKINNLIFDIKKDK